MANLDQLVITCGFTITFIVGSRICLVSKVFVRVSWVSSPLQKKFQLGLDIDVWILWHLPLRPWILYRILDRSPQNTIPLGDSNWYSYCEGVPPSPGLPSTRKRWKRHRKRNFTKTFSKMHHFENATFLLWIGSACTAKTELSKNADVTVPECFAHGLRFLDLPKVVRYREGFRKVTFLLL